MKKISILCAGFLFLTLGVPAAIGIENVACPDRIQVTDPQLVKPVAGWTAIVEKAAHVLSGVTFYDGPIAENASLVPDKRVPGKTAKTRETETALWQLDAKSTRGYWLACRYSGTSLTLSRALPKGLTQCAVTYNNHEQIDGLPAIESLACK